MLTWALEPWPLAEEAAAVVFLGRPTLAVEAVLVLSLLSLMMMMMLSEGDPLSSC
jgi:hypothetical protein